jgi:hypothetical protein
MRVWPPVKLGRPVKTLVISESDRQELDRIVKSRTVSAGLRGRAQIVLLSTQERSSAQIGSELGVTAQTVCK